MPQSQNLNCSFILEHHICHILMITHGTITQTVPAHAHSRNSYEAHYISRGQGRLTACGCSYPLFPGTLFLTGPGIVHQQETDPENPMLEDCLYFYIEENPAYEKEGLTTENAGSITRLLRDNPFWYGQDRQNLPAILQMIHQELPLRSIGHSISLSACFQRYLVALARNMAVSGSEEMKPLRPFQLEIESAFLYRFRDITLDDICEIVGLCRRQTQRILQKYYGCGFQQKRTQARMSAAAAYLDQGSCRAEEIAELTGYSSLSSFLQAFKSYYHMTVREYRQQHK